MIRLVTWLIILLLTACVGKPSEEESANSPELAPPLAAHVSQTRALLDRGLYLKAAELCEAGLLLDSTSVELHNLRATAYTAEGRYALAIESLGQIIRLQPDAALAYLNLGGIHTKLGQYAEAEKFLLQAHVLAPEQSEIHRRLGEVYLGTDRFALAAEEFEHALERFPEDATFYYFLGRAREGMGENEAALAAFERAIELDIGFSEACYRAALFARKLRKTDLARSAMSRYQHLQRIGNGDPDVPKQLNKLRASILNAPEYPPHHFKLGQFFALHGYLEEAENKFAQTARLRPDDASMLNRIAGVLLKQQRTETAVDYYLKALNANPEFLPALLNMAGVLDLQEQHEEALQYYQKALQTAPDDPRVWYNLGLSELHADHRNEARLAWEKGLSLAPTDSPLRERIQTVLAELEKEN
jgi:protein O-GlcNAc transferase